MIDQLHSTSLAHPKNGVETPLYSDRQIVIAEDLNLDRQSHAQEIANLRRLTVGFGIVAGLIPVITDDKLVIEPGYGITPFGDELYLPGRVLLDVADLRSKMQDLCGPTKSDCSSLQKDALDEESKNLFAWIIARPTAIESGYRPGVPQGCDHPGNQLLPTRKCLGVSIELVCSISEIHIPRPPSCEDISKYICGKDGQIAMLPLPTAPAADENYLVIAKVQNNDFMNDIILINGIGLARHADFSQHGISKLTEIMELSDSTIADIENTMKQPGIFARQNWKKQASEIVSGADPSAELDRFLASLNEVALIDGIGKIRQDILAEEGVTQLEQVAALTESEISELEKKLDAPGIFSDEQWVSQAKDLLSGAPPRAHIDKFLATIKTKRTGFEITTSDRRQLLPVSIIQDWLRSCKCSDVVKDHPEVDVEEEQEEETEEENGNGVVLNPPIKGPKLDEDIISDIVLDENLRDKQWTDFGKDLGRIDEGVLVAPGANPGIEFGEIIHAPIRDTINFLKEPEIIDKLVVSGASSPESFLKMDNNILVEQLGKSKAEIQKIKGEMTQAMKLKTPIF